MTRVGRRGLAIASVSLLFALAPAIAAAQVVGGPPGGYGFANTPATGQPGFAAGARPSQSGARVAAAPAGAAGNAAAGAANAAGNAAVGAATQWSAETVTAAQSFGTMDITSAGSTPSSVGTWVNGRSAAEKAELSGRCSVINSAANSSRYSAEAQAFCRNLQTAQNTNGSTVK